MTRRESLLACAGIVAGWVAAVAGHATAHRVLAETACPKSSDLPEHYDPTELRGIRGKLSDFSGPPLRWVHMNWLDGRLS